ncbi:MAG: amino acid permease [Mycoplasmatales bacterium]|nr:amino acid permease [Mycoplasmatales bacterium]
MKKIKQISYMSALIIIIGSTIGAGIFFKNGELFKQAQGNMWLVISSWLVAGIGMIALGLAVVEISSASKTNRGTLEWTKNFLPKWMNTSAKNYIQLIFIPITLFTMPLYVVETWQEAGMDISAWGSLAMAFFVFAWIAGISFVSLKASEVTQWILTALKFLPVIVLPLIAISNIGSTDIIDKGIKAKSGLLGISPAIILIGGIPAISFAFDGFYEVSSLRNDLKRPKSLGPIIVVGVSIILAIYIGITIAFSIGSKDGTIDGIPMTPETKRILNILVGIGIVGIVNGYMMGSVEQNASLHEEGESPVTYLLAKPLNYINRKLFNAKKDISTRMLAWIYIVISTIIFFAIFGPMGIYAWNDNQYYSWMAAGTLYTFADILVNYTSSFIFGIITISIIGGVVNRFTNKIKVQKSKLFVPSAIVAIMIIIPGILFQLVTGIVDTTGYNGSDPSDAIIQLSIFAGIVLFSIIFGLIENRFWNIESHKMVTKNTELESLAESKNR